jgi:hypothetical protein
VLGSLNLRQHRAGEERVRPKVLGALIQVAGVGVVLLGFAMGSVALKVGHSDPRLETRAAVMGLVIWFALISTGSWLYRRGRKVRNPDWKPKPNRSFRLSR